MAININDQPYSWTPRGQKLIYILNSDNVANSGFKFGISVIDIADGKTYEFFLDPSPTGEVYFDLNPLVNLRNSEYLYAHSTTSATYTEIEGNSWKSFQLTFTEWWIVAGIFTQNEGISAVTTTAVYNGYLQPSNGYKPDVFYDSDKTIKIPNNTNTDYLQSDRQTNTHVWDMAESFNININDAVFIPALDSDYGLLFCQGIDTYSTPNLATKYRVEVWDGNGTPGSIIVDLHGDPQEGIPCGTSNLSNSAIPSMPNPLSPNGWRYYRISLLNASNSRVSKFYYFYNAEKYGQFDCRHDNVRVAWVSSRGGWDYQNFIKKNDVTNQIERKEFKRVLFNGTASIFSPNDRQQYDRQNIVTRTLTINSDWLQENEYIFLRSLIASNQVEIINTNGTSTPVSIDETSFLERRERNGKLYNITLKLSYSQDYWS